MQYTIKSKSLGIDYKLPASYITPCGEQYIKFGVYRPSYVKKVKGVLTESDATGYFVSDSIGLNDAAWDKIVKSNLDDVDKEFQLVNLLNSYGLQHGLDEDQLDTCLKDEELQNKLLSLQVDSQNIFGVESTPTFIVGGEKVQGNRPASEFIKIISKKLNQ